MGFRRQTGLLRLLLTQIPCQMHGLGLVANPNVLMHSLHPSQLVVGPGIAVIELNVHASLADGLVLGANPVSAGQPVLLQRTH